MQVSGEHSKMILERDAVAPDDGAGRAMDVYLRLLAEQASAALAAHDYARLATEAERLRRLKLLD